ncbi:hypothetical protein HanIR_Chr05g0249781 [Helianthus annuus]|nr:hypothetical protein HanIR_Chr05g0249781 [Helianthus annuus]
MEGSAKVEFSTHSSLKSLPETRGKTSITIRNDVDGNTMTTDYLLHVDLSQFLDFEIFTNREEVS